MNRGSFDVKPSYISGDYVGVFSQEWLDFHINAQYFTPDSPMWYSYHSFGIPLLLSPFLLAAQYVHIAPLAALQLGMVLLQALGVVVLYLYKLIVGIGVMLAMLLGGIVVAQRKRAEAQTVRSRMSEALIVDAEVQVTSGKL